MNDLLGKMTFGFLMAQLIPGAVLFLAIAFYGDLLDQTPKPFYSAIRESISAEESSSSEAEVKTEIIRGFMKRATAMSKEWTESVDRLLLLVLGSIGLGLGLHGLNWTVIAYLENTQTDDGVPRPMFQLKQHQRPVAIQLLMAPATMLSEVAAMLIKSKSIYDVAIGENINKVSAEDMDKHRFLQDFYLYFAQFYSHLSYSFLFIVFVQFFSVLVYAQPSYPKAIGVLVSAWLMCGMLFVFGRSQFCALFVAEERLKAEDSANRTNLNFS